MPLKENVLWNREELFFPEAAPIDSFCLVLRSRIVSSCLGMAAYEDVCSWVDSTLAIKPELRHLTDMKEWPIFVRPHYRTVHFCKALALERMGKLEEAIRCAELALKVEPGNETVFHWLKVFRRKREAERVRREKRSKKNRFQESKTRRNGRA